MKQELVRLIFSKRVASVLLIAIYGLQTCMWSGLAFAGQEKQTRAVPFTSADLFFPDIALSHLSQSIGTVPEADLFKNDLVETESSFVLAEGVVPFPRTLELDWEIIEREAYSDFDRQVVREEHDRISVASVTTARSYFRGEPYRLQIQHIAYPNEKLYDAAGRLAMYSEIKFRGLSVSGEDLGTVTLRLGHHPPTGTPESDGDDHGMEQGLRTSSQGWNNHWTNFIRVFTYPPYINPLELAIPVYDPSSTILIGVRPGPKAQAINNALAAAIAAALGTLTLPETQTGPDSVDPLGALVLAQAMGNLNASVSCYAAAALGLVVGSVVGKLLAVAFTWLLSHIAAAVPTLFNSIVVLISRYGALIHALRLGSLVAEIHLIQVALTKNLSNTTREFLEKIIGEHQQAISAELQHIRRHNYRHNVLRSKLAQASYSKRVFVINEYLRTSFSSRVIGLASEVIMSIVVAYGTYQECERKKAWPAIMRANLGTRFRLYNPVTRQERVLTAFTAATHNNPIHTYTLTNLEELRPFLVQDTSDGTWYLLADISLLDPRELGRHNTIRVSTVLNPSETVVNAGITGIGFGGPDSWGHEILAESHVLLKKNSVLFTMQETSSAHPTPGLWMHYRASSDRPGEPEHTLTSCALRGPGPVSWCQWKVLTHTDPPKPPSTLPESPAMTFRIVLPTPTPQ